jgi:hypothetical protein
MKIKTLQAVRFTFKCLRNNHAISLIWVCPMVAINLITAALLRLLQKGNPTSYIVFVSIIGIFAFALRYTLKKTAESAADMDRVYFQIQFEVYPRDNNVYVYSCIFTYARRSKVSIHPGNTDHPIK